MYGLSQDYWHPQHLMDIARGVGTPLQLDKATKECEFGYYARMLVDVDLANELPSSLMVEREAHCFPIEIVYENICTHCGMVGHMADRCRQLQGDPKPRHSEKPILKPKVRQEYRVKEKVSNDQSIETQPSVSPTEINGTVPSHTETCTVIAEVDQGMNFESRDIDEERTIEDNGRDIDEGRTIKYNRRASTPDDRASVPRPCTHTSSENLFVTLAHEAIVGAANELIEQLADQVFQGPNAQTLDVENSMVVTNEALDDVEGLFPTPSTRTEDNATVVREPEDAIDQQLIISCGLENVNCILTWVYARTMVTERCWLWNDLLHVKNAFVQGPWIVLGDFNCVLGAHEKRGGILPNVVSCSDFQDMSTNYELVHLPTKGLPYTWTNRRGIGASVEMRVDRCLSNFSWMDVWRNLECTTFPHFPSYHCPLLVSFSKLIPNQISLFRFHRMWLDHPSFLSLVKKVWQSFHFYGNPMFVLASKLQTLKQQIRFDPSDDLLSKESVVSAQVHEALLLQEKFLCDKSRIKWLTEGDRNSSFFHAIVKVRHLKHSLSSMRDGNSIIDDPKEISDHVLNYFNDIFTADSFVRDTGLVSQVIPNLVTTEYNAMLTAIPTSEEIFQTMCSMDHNSSHGLYGFGGIFFMKCWSVVGAEVVQVVQSFFNTRYILPHFNSNLMILIPKVLGADTVTQLRPIAMANFIFKLITKILTDRLGSIADPIILTSECINLLHRNYKGDNIAIKFDVQKAFDTLDWDPFCDWIKAILESEHLSILVNGEMKGFFPCSRGVRQGDPLSPILFCLAEEVLSIGLIKLAEDGFIDLLSAPLGITPPSHVLFADDIMLVFLEKYAHRRRFVIRKILGVKQGSLPFTYLGVSIFQRRPKRVYFQDIANRVRCKLSSWKGYLLSQAGRLQLIQSVIKRILVYSFQIYEGPAGLFHDLQSCVGDGKRISFWKDNWLGEPLTTSVGISGYISLHAKVNDVIVDSYWVLPADFIFSFPQATEKIERIALPDADTSDFLLWPHSSSRILTAKEAFVFFSNHGEHKDWDKVIWSKAIQPRKTLIV
ncbi:uncharacterized protein LOC126797093 [Argentina anserina]|uniref:uncharacterized protein LOC126797093 n=1 Tax=Argentina anserina TaxID=57926 RepID=UPI0021768F44|nr:uncharacterized protein LOC126797093 [Potentilla anserina]